MIASVRGRVLAVAPGTATVEVGGVGLVLSVTASAARRAADAERRGDEVVLVTHLHVREDALQLFGFASAGERVLFELLLGVSGVGPKAALAIVSGYAPDQLRRAVAAGDAALFTSIPGVGKKTAERILVDLRDKVAAVALAAVPGPPAADAGADGDGHGAARDALVSLGMTVAEAEAALRDVDDDLPVEERVRAALAGGVAVRA